MILQYARGRTPRDYEHIDIFDGMGYIEEGVYSLNTLANRGWEVVNINGWHLDKAYVLLMRKDVKSEPVERADNSAELLEVAAALKTSVIKK